MRKNTNSLFFCLINVACYLTDSLRGPVNKPKDEGRSPEFDGTDGTDGTDGNQKFPLIFFILCRYIDNLYMSPTFLSIFSIFSKTLSPEFFPFYCGQRRVFDTFNLLAEICQKDNLILGDFRCSI